MSHSQAYVVKIRWSKPDSAYTAEIPDLPGCLADGETREEAVAAIEVAMREWIETARELGRGIPEPAHR
jgi:predicted RNase H-like HicB family nuclease